MGCKQQVSAARVETIFFLFVFLVPIYAEFKFNFDLIDPHNEWNNTAEKKSTLIRSVHDEYTRRRAG